MKWYKLSLSVCCICLVLKVKSELQCTAPFRPPSQCFSLDDISQYGQSSTMIESLYNRYVNLLTEAGFTISGDEPGVNLFFGGELSQKVRKLKYYGNSVVTFLKTAFHHLCHEHGLSAEQMFYCLEQANVTADLFEVCEQYDAIDCSSRMTTYQPLNGVCVNQDDPYRGAINTPYRRLLKNSYEDSIHEVRSSAHDDNLPSARLISTGLRTLYMPIHFDSSDNLINDLVLFYASQAVYDIAKTLKAQTWSGNYGFDCCDCDGSKMSPRFANRHCMPIEIPKRDPVFKGQRCMNFVRSMVTHDNCKLQEASILNSVSHYLDMDFLYVKDTMKLAIKSEGKFSEDENGIHTTIILGDERSVMFPQFFSLAVVWLKFHNIVVDELSRLYPNLPPDVKFYEARRFIIALYQNILFSEVLPLIISPRAMARYRLSSQKACFNSNVDPSVTAEFVSSAGRYLHTFIQNNYTVNFKNGTSRDIPLRHLNDESLGYHELTGVITGLLERPWNYLDIAHEPSNYLFSSNGEPGLDLRAMDIQTERDFGIGTYCDALYYFNLTRGSCIKRFADFEPFITDSNIAFLKYAYDEPCDVDFGVGASMHSSDDGDLLSDLIDRVFALQFKSLKCGDPYFYTNALNKDQIEFVDNMSFSDILCLTLHDLSSIQPFVFLTPGPNNTREACNVNFSLEGWELSVNPHQPVANVPTDPPHRTTPFEMPTQ